MTVAIDKAAAVAGINKDSVSMIIRGLVIEMMLTITMIMTTRAIITMIAIKTAEKHVSNDLSNSCNGNKDGINNRSLGLRIKAMISSKTENQQ